MSRETRNWRTAFALALLGAAASPAALAADTKTGQLEEIVVTATRHEETLSKVPISVTALSQETLDQKGIKDFQDIVRFTPGVAIDQSGTNAISIRGISSSAGAGTTGIYIDDTPIQMRSIGFNPDDTLPKTFDLERVEVLRGPQGTLFGSGSEGGTVRYIMTQPSLTKESTYVRSEVSTTRGGEPSFEAGIAHGGPIVDNVLGYRASVWYRYDGGWIDRVDPYTMQTSEQHANHANTLAARLAFIVQPKDGFTITPSLTYQNSRKHDESTYWPAFSGDGHFNNLTPERMPVPDEYYLPALKIEADLGKARFISNTSYYHRLEQTGYQGTMYDLAFYQSQVWLVGSCGANYPAFDANTGCPWYPLLDGKGIHLPPADPNTGWNPAGYATPNVMTNKQESWTQEFRLQSNDDSSRLKWTIGAFWSLSKSTSIEELKDTQIMPLWQTLFGINPQDWFYLAPATSGDYYYCNGQGTQQALVPNCDIYINHNVVFDRQIAGFGELTYSFNDQWKVTAGGRIAKMSFDLSHHGDGLENYGPDDAAAHQSESAFTPKLGLSFQADPNNLYYFTYAKGFRPGGGNPPLPAYCNGDGGLAQSGYADGAPLTYKSDSTNSFEVGSKNNFNNRVKIATSVYWIKWNDIQQSVYVPYNCGLQFIDNLGTAIAKGFDIQAEMLLGGGFSADVAVGYTSARYSDSRILYDTTQNPPVPHVLAGTGDAISGQAAIDGGPGTIPPWNASVGLQYNFSLAARDAFVRLDWEYTSRNPWLAAVQDPATTQYSPFTYSLPSTSFASLRAGVTLDKLQLAFFVDNLFDTRTITNYQLSQNDSNSPTGLSASVQQNAYTFRPRTIGVTATWRM
ncbi:MAG: TonB-dependent receptor [Proteobacteria bacterium]|nr:TonB-dependent receptor [Pseudomonadota bacterium]